jgi:hypothetical protein
MEGTRGLVRSPSVARILIGDNVPVAVIEHDFDSKVRIEDVLMIWRRRSARQDDFFNSLAIRRGNVHSITLVLRFH